MTEPAPTISDRLTRVTTLLGAVTTLAGGVTALVREIKPVAVPVVDQLKDLPAAMRWPIILALLALSVWLFRKFRTRRVGPRPVATSANFVGRELETRNLRRRSADHGLVYLVGESGVGKSELVEHALRSAAKDSGELEAIIVRTWGDDWDQGPARYLASELQRLCPNSTTVPEDTSWIERARLIAKQHNQPLKLVFDGFDDYSVRYHEQLFDKDGCRFLYPVELRERNRLWDAIAGLISSDIAHCVFVTRSDAQGALVAVRFQEPETLLISRLSEDEARQMLDSVFAASAAGGEWDALRDQLLRDLNEAGGVLPAQVMSAARAIGSMRTRTLREYRARGGLIGLEVEQLDGVVRRAAHAVGVPIAFVRDLLTSMVDASSSPPKARIMQWPVLPRPAPAAGDQWPAAIGADKLGALMTSLADEQVVREMAGETPTWILHHDYIARIVLAMTRRLDRWTAQLSDAHRAFAATRAPWTRWRALLPLSTQLVLALRRVTPPKTGSKFRYGKLRGFALASTAKIVPYLIVAVLLVYWRSASHADDAGRHLFSRLSSPASSLQPDEVNALWDLQQEDHRVQDAAIRHALELPETAATFSRRADVMVHAIVGFDRKRRGQLLGMVVQARCLSSTEVDLRIAAACVRVGVVLEEDSDALWTFVISSLWRKIQTSGTPGDSEPSLDDWFNWINESVVPRKLAASAQQAFWTGFERMLSEHAAARTRTYYNDQTSKPLLQGIDQLIKKFGLAPSAAPQLVKQIAAAQAFPIELRIPLVWDIAVRAPEKVDSYVANMLLALTSRFRVFRYTNTWNGIGRASAWNDTATSSDLPGSADLYLALIRYAQTHAEVKDRLLSILDNLFSEAPIEASERPRVRSALDRALPKSPPIDDFDGSGDHKPFDEVGTRKQFSNNVARLTPQLRKISRGDLADKISALGTKWIALEAARRSGDRKAFVERFWDATNGDLAACVLTAAFQTLAADDKQFQDRSWNTKDPKETWFHACLISAEMLDSDGEAPSKPDAPKPRAQNPTLDSLLRDVVTGRRPLASDDSLEFDLHVATGKATTAAAAEFMDVLVSTADKRPELIGALMSTGNKIIELTSKPEELAKHLVELTRRNDSASATRLVVGMLGAMEARYLRIEGVASLLVRAITLMHEDAQALSLSQPMAKLCDNVIGQRSLVSNRLSYVMLHTTDLAQLDALRPCLFALRADLRPKDVVTLLEWPTCVGRCRTDLLHVLSDGSAQQSGSMFWAVEAWARRSGLLSDAPVTRPSAE